MVSQVAPVLIGAALALLLRQLGLALIARLRSSRTDPVIQERLARLCPPQR